MRRECDLIPLHVFLGLRDMFRDMFKECHKTSALRAQHIFLHDGQPGRLLKGALKAACKVAGTIYFRFRDLRRTVITNMPRAQYSSTDYHANQWSQNDGLFHSVQQLP